MQIDGHLIFDRGVAFPTAHAERIWMYRPHHH